MTEAQQATTAWQPPTGPLGALTADARQRAASAAASRQALERVVRDMAPAVSFRAALRHDSVQVIAELKRRSPSKGAINETLDAPACARRYAEAGAAALSVLTEPSHFGGSLDDLRAVHAVTRLPLLRKDFIVDEIQLVEARAFGASAVLLIARGLPPAQLRTLAHRAQELGLDVLLEVRDEEELDRALDVPHAVIGVNNRNLETLVLDDAVSARLLPRVPTDRIAVYESGVTDRAAVERAGAFGADAVLVGSALSASSDARAALAALLSVRRHARG